MSDPEESERYAAIVENNQLMRTLLKRMDTLETRVKALEDHCRLSKDSRCPYCGHPNSHEPWCENKHPK